MSGLLMWVCLGLLVLSQLLYVGFCIRSRVQAGVPLPSLLQLLGTDGVAVVQRLPEAGVTARMLRGLFLARQLFGFLFVLLFLARFLARRYPDFVQLMTSLAS